MSNDEISNTRDYRGNTSPMYTGTTVVHPQQQRVGQVMTAVSFNGEVIDGTNSLR